MSKFDVQPVSAPKRGTFRLGNMHTTTLDFGRLQVAKIMECVPNDVINLNMNAFCQAAPNPSPINGKMSLSLHAFFVPTRVICSEWNNYILGLSNPTLPWVDSMDISNAITSIGTSLGSHAANEARRHLSDFGLPSGYMDGANMNFYKVSALPFRAFTRVWWDWYRDKQRLSDANMSTYVFNSMGHVSSSEISGLVSAYYRCFSKDYITTAYDVPAEDNKEAAVPVLFNSTGYTSGQTPMFSNLGNADEYNDGSSTTRGALGSYGAIRKTSTANQAYLTDGTSTSSTSTVSKANAITRNISTGSTDYGTSSVTNGLQYTTVPQLRGAAAYQRYLERLNVAGKSIISRLKALFNADDTPERLDMSEYLGGTSQDFTFENTTATSTGMNSSASTGTMNAFGYYGASASEENIIGQKVSNGVCNLDFGNITYHAKEHGYLLVISSILPVVSNYQGIDRMFLRGVATGTSSRFDFFTPDMENVGFQPILLSEVVTPSPLSGTIPATYDGLSVFGWQQRYMDYKFSKDTVSGDFVLPSTGVSLQSFHLGRNVLREFGFVDQAGAAITGSTAPNNYNAITPGNLVTCDIPSRSMYDDKFTVSSDQLDHFIINYKFDITAVRPMEENVLPAIDQAESQAIMNIPTGGVRL